MLVTMSHTTTATFLLGWAVVITLTEGNVPYANVASSTSYNQSSTSPDQQGANVGADRDSDSCVLTREDGAQYMDHPWYEVDMGRVYPVYQLDIVSRINYQRRLYPSTITVDGEPCAIGLTAPYHGEQQNIFPCSKIMYGQRVRLTLDRTDQPLNLCELTIWVYYQVSQCPAGKYGPSCDKYCNDHCGQGRGKNFCEKYTAICYGGCVDGWYGDWCSHPCSQGCHNDYCDSDTGLCVQCNTGYKGDTCADCEDKHFQTSSGECMPCSSSCWSQRCSFTSGTCASCVDGHYGDQCDKNCPTKHCLRCDQTSGNCTTCDLDSDLLAPDCTVSTGDLVDTNDMMLYGGIAGVIIAFVIVVVVVIFIIVRRRCQKKDKSWESPDEDAQIASPWTESHKLRDNTEM